jgi:hypothetical protein
MKKLFLIPFAALALLSCEEDKVFYGDETFVSFTDVSVSNVSIPEDAETYVFKIGIARKQSQDVTVNFDVTEGTAELGVHFNMPTSIVIPAGEQFADLAVEIIDDEDQNTTRSFELLITSVSNGMEVGIADVGSYKKNVGIVNNDCPTKFTYWLGSLSVEDVGYGSTPGTGSANANGDCDILVVNNNLPGETGAIQNTIFDVLFTPTNGDGTIGTVLVNPTFVRQRTSGGVLYDCKYYGTGTYSTVTGIVTINYQYRAYNASTGVYAGNFWTGTNRITRQ